MAEAGPGNDLWSRADLARGISSAIGTPRVARIAYRRLGVTLLVGAFVIQWATLMSGFLHLHDGKIEISVETYVQDLQAPYILYIHVSVMTNFNLPGVNKILSIVPV